MRLFHAVNQALGGLDTLTASANRRRALRALRGNNTPDQLEEDFTSLQAMGDHGFSAQEQAAIAHGLPNQEAVKQYYDRMTQTPTARPGAVASSLETGHLSPETNARNGRLN
eukprot:COSAG03_NODE_1297_length_4381_cov_9.335357_2_plen_112_part_00